jgi:hypothetical protein
VNAQPLYEKLGFQITGKELWKGTPYERIYQEQRFSMRSVALSIDTGTQP